MKKYKVTMKEFGNQQVVSATRIEYIDGFVLFYNNAELIAVVNHPLAVVKKPD